MTTQEAIVGTRIKTNAAFSCVPLDTEGVIDEDYGTGIMVAWDLPDQPLPKGYSRHDGSPAIKHRLLRDGFDKETELHFLTILPRKIMPSPLHRNSSQ